MSRKRSIEKLSEEKEKLATSYYEYLLRLGYQGKSSKSRYHFLREYLQQQGCNQISTQLEKTTTQDIINYRNYLQQRESRNEANKPLSEKSIYTHLQNLRHFFEYLKEVNKLEINPFSSFKIESPKEEIAERIILTQEEIQELYEVTENHQERALLSLGYGCGLRVGEMENLEIEDIRIEEKTVVVKRGKGAKRRVVPMSENVVNDLKSYYEKEYYSLTKGRNYNSTSKAFMLDSRGGKMKYYTYNKYLKKILKRAFPPLGETGKGVITIHNLRHSIATHFLEQGISVEQVRLFLGHSELETTQIYTHISKKQLSKLTQK